MLSLFFIDRPIFAWVIAIVIMLAGALAIRTLPVAQYPNIAEPQVSITAVYPGASAKTVEDSVTQVIEQKMKGLDGLLYMSSTSDAAGLAQITLTFESKTDPDIAQVQVQNKLQSAIALLPQEVQQQGLTVAKAQRNFMMVIGLYGDNGKYTDIDLADYLASHIQDPISRVEGVGDVQLFGSQYAMRLWLDPNKLNSFNLTPADIAAAVRAQNAQVSAGQLGGTPATAPSRGCRRPNSSGRSSSRPTRTARSCAWATSPAWSSAPKATIPPPTTTASRPPASPSSWPPAPTP